MPCSRLISNTISSHGECKMSPNVPFIYVNPRVVFGSVQCVSKAHISSLMHMLPRGTDSCLISSVAQETVARAVKHINEVLRVSIDNPDLMNELKAVQLRELAALNGTLREDVAPACTNCGSTEHRCVEVCQSRLLGEICVWYLCMAWGRVVDYVAPKVPVIPPSNVVEYLIALTLDADTGNARKRRTSRTTFYVTSAAGLAILRATATSVLARVRPRRSCRLAAITMVLSTGMSVVRYLLLLIAVVEVVPVAIVYIARYILSTMVLPTGMRRACSGALLVAGFIAVVGVVPVAIVYIARFYSTVYTDYQSERSCTQ